MSSWRHLFGFNKRIIASNLLWPVYTIDTKSDHGRWFFSKVRRDGSTSMVWFLKKKQITKPLGPSLGVNWMWTKRNDCAPKSEWVDFFYYMPKKGSFGKSSSLTILLSSLVFTSQKQFHWKFIITTFLCHVPLPFSTKTLFCLSHRKNPLDHVSG